MKDRLDEALDERAGEPGTVEFDAGEGRKAAVDVEQAESIGVRVRRVRVTREAPVDVAKEAARLPERLHSLGTPLHPVEVAPVLGGAILRSEPGVDREFYEADVRPGETELRRLRPREGGGRDAIDWTLTREQLRKLIDEL